MEHPAQRVLCIDAGGKKSAGIAKGARATAPLALGGAAKN